MVLGLILRERETAVSEWREMKHECTRCYGKGDWSQAFLDPALIKSCMMRLLNFWESQFSYLRNEDNCILLGRVKAAWFPDTISAYIMILPSTLLSTCESLVCLFYTRNWKSNLSGWFKIQCNVETEGWLQKVCNAGQRLGVWSSGMAEDIFQLSGDGGWATKLLKRQWRQLSSWQRPSFPAAFLCQPGRNPHHCLRAGCSQFWPGSWPHCWPPRLPPAFPAASVECF